MNQIKNFDNHILDLVLTNIESNVTKEKSLVKNVDPYHPPLY